MNQAKLCVIVIMLCVIAPVMVGYAWPVDADDIPIYQVENTKDITKDLANSQVDIYTDVTDPWINNSYLTRNETGVGVINALNPKTVTTNQGAVPYFLDYIGNEQLDPGLDEEITINAYTWGNGFHPTVAGEKYIGFDMIPQAGQRIFVDGVRVSFLRYWAFSDILQYAPSADTGWITAQSKNITIKEPGVIGDINVYVGWIMAQGNGNQYAHLPNGFIVPNKTAGYGSAKWMNGYVNSQMDMILQLNSLNEIQFQIGYGNPDILIVRSTAGLVLQTRIDGDSGYQTIGTIDDYPYVLVHIDALQKKVTISGLLGMRDFTDDYSRHIRASVDLSMPALTPFDTVYFQNWDHTNGNALYYVAKTVAQTRTTQGINNSTMDLCLYLGPSGDGQISIRNVIKWPLEANGFTIRINNSTTYYGTISYDGILTFEGKDFPIKDLAVLLIGNTVYLNGTPVIEWGSLINSCKIGFKGQYLATIYYSDLKTEYQSEYSWLPGGFGLDQSGFCMVGIMTSAGSGLAAALAGRRSGSKALLVTITAAICGMVYLIMLMQ